MHTKAVTNYMNYHNPVDLVLVFLLGVGGEGGGGCSPHNVSDFRFNKNHSRKVTRGTSEVNAQGHCLTTSLPRGHLKMTNNSARFETLEPFCLLFCTGM